MEPDGCSAWSSCCRCGRCSSSPRRSGDRRVRAIGDTFLIVFVGIFLALVFEYPVRFVMAKTHMSRGLAATVTVLGTAVAVVGRRCCFLVPLVGGVRDFLQDLPETVEQLRNSDELSWPATPARPGTCRRAPRGLRLRARRDLARCSASPATSSRVFLAGFTILFICLFLLTRLGEPQAVAGERADAGRGERWLASGSA